MFTLKKSYIIGYLVSAISLIIIGYLTSSSPEEALQVKPINFEAVVVIFSYNSLIILLLMLFSFTGISFLYIGNFLMSIGASSKMSGVDPFLYYISSLTHGLMELLLGAIVVFYSFIHINKLVSFFFNKIQWNELKNFYKKTLTQVLPVTLLVLAVGAITEVYISNPLIRFFTT